MCTPPIFASLEHLKYLSIQIQTAYTDLCQVGEVNLSRRRIDTRLSALKEDWKEFSHCHKALGVDIAHLNMSDLQQIRADPYFSGDFFKITRDYFLDIVERMGNLLDSLPVTQSSHTTVAQVQASSSTIPQVN